MLPKTCDEGDSMFSMFSDVKKVKAHKLTFTHDLDTSDPLASSNSQSCPSHIV